MKKFYLFAGLWAALFSLNAQNVADFENIQLDSASWWNGSDGSVGFNSGGFYFPNDYNTDWGSWSGFSVSNMNDSATAGWENQYSAITADGVNGSQNYAVVYIDGKLTMEFDNPIQLKGTYVTNSTYAYLSMKNGDDFTKKFGGPDGTDPDYFKLIVAGTDIFGNETDPIEFMLADFTFEDNEMDYIVKAWRWFDLSSLGAVTEIHFSLESTDRGTWGMNTPAYFCIDNFNGTPSSGSPLVEKAGMEDLNLAEDSFYNGSDGAGSFTSGDFTFQNSYNADWGSWSGFAASTITDNETKGWENQYSAIPGEGALETDAYAVAYVSGYSEVEFPETVVSGMYITNSTYTYHAMKEGDVFSKKFGGADGSESDWLKVTVAGISSSGDTTGLIDYYLADFRFEDEEKDYIVDSWEWLNLSELGEVSKLRFSMSSSDVGDWGMNTPSYFCIDQLNYDEQAPVLQNPIATIGESGIAEEVFYVPLDSVFYDPDSEFRLKLEYIDNRELLLGQIVKKGKPGFDERVTLALNVTPAKTGEATVTISATSNGKTAYHSFKVVLFAPVSVDAISQNEIKIYPNPVQSYLILEFSSQIHRVEMVDLSGKIIRQFTGLNQDNIKMENLSDLPAGIYILKMRTEDGTYQQKVVK